MTIHNALHLTSPSRSIILDRDYEHETVTVHLDNGVHVVKATFPTATLQELVRKAGL